MTKYTVIGLDIAKTVFHLVILKAGKEVSRKKLRRSQLLRFIANQAECHIAMEACATSHYWSRQFHELGHTVTLLAPQHVKGYLRGQKNDYNDAKAIAEAYHHGAIRSVPIKNVEQQDDQAFHRLRRHLVSEQTRLSNQIRSLLAEYGIIVPQGVKCLRRRLPELLEDAENGLTSNFRELLNRQYARLAELHNELLWYERKLRRQMKEDTSCNRLQTIPGFGPVVSSAFKSWIGDGKQFKRGRDASAALGLVPRQHSTGGKDKLLGISKRGDRYVRCLLIHGARAVIARADKKEDKLSRWACHLVETRGKNKAIVALANKLARIAWVVVARETSYSPVA